MPLFAHFRLVIFMRVLLVELGYAVGVSTLVIEHTLPRLHEVFTQLSLVVDPKIFDVLDHLLPR